VWPTGFARLRAALPSPYRCTDRRCASSPAPLPRSRRPPEVHSTVFRWRFAPRFQELGVEEPGFLRLIRIAFAQKRKDPGQQPARRRNAARSSRSRIGSGRHRPQRPAPKPFPSRPLRLCGAVCKRKGPLRLSKQPPILNRQVLSPTVVNRKIPVSCHLTRSGRICSSFCSLLPAQVRRWRMPTCTKAAISLASARVATA